MYHNDSVWSASTFLSSIRSQPRAKEMYGQWSASSIVAWGVGSSNSPLHAYATNEPIPLRYSLYTKGYNEHILIRIDPDYKKWPKGIYYIYRYIYVTIGFVMFCIYTRLVELGFLKYAANGYRLYVALLPRKFRIRAKVPSNTSHWKSRKKIYIADIDLYIITCIDIYIEYMIFIVYNIYSDGHPDMRI